MAENYDLIFGQSASSQYAWDDSDYQNGWQTVGSTPPTAEQFDALQRKNDTKAKDLNDRLSPLETKAEADGRQAATSYTLGAMLTVDGLPNGWLLECIAPGVSGTDAITLPDTLIDGLTIIDGSVTWALRKVATYGGLGYRQPSTAYAVGNIAYHASLPTGHYLECTTAGTTGSGDITLPSPIAEKDTVTDGAVTWTIRKIGSEDVMPIGGILPFAGNGAVPAGYLLCDGAAVSRTMYSDLFSVIGTTYGAGDGSTTFNLPDLTDKFIEGHTTAGTSKNAGLPNITGEIESSEKENQFPVIDDSDATLAGAFYVKKVETRRRKDSSFIGTNIYVSNLGFDASKSNAIYGASDTVQPPSLTCRYVIKYK